MKQSKIALVLLWLSLTFSATPWAQPSAQAPAPNPDGPYHDNHAAAIKAFFESVLY